MLNKISNLSESHVQKKKRYGAGGKSVFDSDGREVQPLLNDRKKKRILKSEDQENQKVHQASGVQVSFNGPGAKSKIGALGSSRVEEEKNVY